MAGVATKKPDGDRGLQLTFPLNFQKAFDAGFAYFPSGGGDVMDIMVGHDFQSKRHEENRLEANQSVMNGLQAREASKRLMMTGPHNYHLPKPVLGQRRYANPSYGAEAYTSTRRDNGEEAPFRTVDSSAMVGGVLRTAQGYDFYKGQLKKRIEELNRINAIAQGYAVPMGQTVDTYNNEKTGSPDKVTFFLYLQGLQDAVVTGNFNRFTFDNMRELIGRLLNFGPSATEEDFNDIQDSVTVMLNSIRKWNESQGDSSTLSSDYEREYASAFTISELLDKIYSYVRLMFSNMNRSEKDKILLSKSLVRSLKLHRLLSSDTNRELIEGSRKDDERTDQIAEDGDDGDADGVFSTGAMGREDSEQYGRPRAPFAGTWGDENREKWGTRGRPEREGEVPGYFGEAVEADQPALVAPLDLAAFDPQSQMPPAGPPPGMTDAIKEIMKQTLAPLATSPEDQTKLQNEEFEDLITTHYPDPKQFVRELDAAATERGYTKAQIAFAVSAFDLAMFSDYVAANMGEVGPTPIVPGFRYPPAGPQVPPPVYAPQADAADDGMPSWLERFPNRAALRAGIRSIAQARQFIATLPPEAGGSYKPRDDSSLKNVMETIIRNIRKVVPTY